VNPNLICLDGAPAAVGKTFGALNASDIAEGVRSFYKTAQDAERLSAQDLVRAGNRYVALVRQYAPHWIPEAEAIASAAGVDAGDRGGPGQHGKGRAAGAEARRPGRRAARPDGGLPPLRRAGGTHAPDALSVLLILPLVLVIVRFAAHALPAS
jgi:hypothetical protein